MRVITIDITFVSGNVHDTTFDPYGHLVEPIFPTSFLYDLSLVPRPSHRQILFTCCIQKLVVGVAGNEATPQKLHWWWEWHGNEATHRCIGFALPVHDTEHIAQPKPVTSLVCMYCSDYRELHCYTLETHLLNICSMSQLLLSSLVMVPMASSFASMSTMS